MNGRFLGQETVPRILHGHSMVPTQAINVARKGTKPCSGESPGSTRDNGVNHAHVIWVQTRQSGQIPVVIQKANFIMHCQVVEECLISFVRGQVQDFLILPNFFGVVVPLLGGDFNLLVLEITSSHMHRRISTTTLCIQGEAQRHSLFLNSFYDFSGGTINDVIIVQIVSNKSFEIVTHFRIREVQHIVKVSQESKLLDLGRKV
mmetsp:Transcript_21381/g.44600  ORF Transcript_21381/g.44600 Transcript_21381/m.44600 type:complete len:204 (-) Transcript_21381:989-1600(-)